MLTATISKSRATTPLWQKMGFVEGSTPLRCVSNMFGSGRSDFLNYCLLLQCRLRSKFHRCDHGQNVSKFQFDNSPDSLSIFVLAEIFHPLDFGAWPTTFELGYCQPHGGRDNQISPQWYNRRIHPDSRVHFQSTPLGRILDIPVGAHMSNCCAEDFQTLSCSSPLRYQTPFEICYSKLIELLNLIQMVLQRYTNSWAGQIIRCGDSEITWPPRVRRQMKLRTEGTFSRPHYESI